jgi:hypothetical protein
MENPLIVNSYWVVPSRLLAGEYPGAADEAQARQRLRWLLGRGITCFVDLTESGEYKLPPYAGLLQDEAALKGREVSYLRLPVPDYATPTQAEMRHIQDLLRADLAAGQIIYLHCYGGVGRTGTVVGCFLRESGLDGQAALAEIARLRRKLSNHWAPSPETESQRRMIENWEVVT